MPHHKSAEKRLRQNEVRRTRNKSIRSDMKTLMKKVSAACEAKDQAAAEAASREAVAAIDRAFKRGVIKGNSAARKKSSVMRQVAAAQS